MSRFRWLVALVVGCGLTLAATSPATADEPKEPFPEGTPLPAGYQEPKVEEAPPEGAVVIAEQEAYLDCEGMSAEVRAYADEHNYCDQVGTNNTRYGNCGESFLYMWNAGGGNTRFYYGFSSYRGTVYWRNIGYSFYNWSTGGGGNYRDASYMWSSSYWNARNQYTRAGFVTGVAWGNVVLWWGGICTLLYPTSSTWTYW